MNNSEYSSSSGFTLLEILVSVFVMSVGFLALSQMEYLSVRQKQMAEEGSNATSIIEYAGERDIAELKIVGLLNSATYLDELNGRDADYTYCDGSSSTSVCSTCPCNPLERITPNPTDGSSDIQCAAVELDDSDYLNLLYTTDSTVCLSDYRALDADALFIIKQADTSVETGTSTVFTVNVTYAAKSLEQFVDSGFSLEPRNNLAVQGLIFTAQVEDYSDIIPISSGAWNSVLVPHTP